MYNFKCKSEFSAGFKECTVCKIPLVENNITEGHLEYSFIELVTVLEAANLPELLIAKSILEDAGIKYFAKGEGLQDLFCGGRIGTGYNMILGSVQIQVGKDDEEEAKSLLKIFIKK